MRLPAVVACSLVLSVVAAAPRAGAAPALTSHETSAPTTFDHSSPEETLTSGSDLGFTYRASSLVGGGGYRLYADPAKVVVPGAYALIAGHTLYTGSRGELSTWTARDLDTGDSWVAQQDEQASSELIGVLPHGVVTEGQDTSASDGPGFTGQDVTVRMHDGATWRLDLGGRAGLPGVVGDDSGILVTWQDPSLQRHAGWFNLSSPHQASGHSTAPGGVPLIEPVSLPAPAVGGASVATTPRLAVSATRLAYVLADGTLTSYVRGTGAVAFSRPGVGPVLGLALTDGGVAWASGQDTQIVTTCVEASGACATVAAATRGEQPEDAPASYRNTEPSAAVDPGATHTTSSGVVAAGDGFAVGVGHTRTDRAVRLFAAGSAVPGRVLDQTGAAPPQSIFLAPGRVVVDLGYRRYEQSVAIGSFGAATPLPGTQSANLMAATSGSLTAAVSGGRSGTYDLVVSDGAAVVQVWKVKPPKDTYVSGGPTFSGDRVLLPESRRSLLFSLSDPSAPPVVEPGNAVVYADRIAWRDGTSIKLRDLDRPGQPVRTLLVGGDSSSTITNGPQLYGDWAFWTVSSYHGSLFDVDTTATAVHLRADGTIDRTVQLPGADVDTARDVVLRAGFVAYVEPDRTVHVRDLGSGADEVIGAAAPAHDNGFGISASDDAVAWVGADNLIHVRQVSPTSQVGPQLLDVTQQITPVAGVTATSTFGARVIAAPRPRPLAPGLHVRIDVSRAVTSWTLVVRDASGHVVARRTGKAAKASIVATWATRIRGRYTWQVTGRGRGGSIVRRAGRAATIKGGFTLS